MTVHDLTVPRPLTGVNSNAGSVLWQCGQTTSGGWVSAAQREHRAIVSTWSAAAFQKPADCSSGTGNGRTSSFTG